MKTCTGCLLPKDESAFSPNRKARDGLQWRCKQCANSATAKWRAANLDKVRMLARAQYWKAPEKGRACSLKNRNADVEKARAAARSWKKRNPDRVRSYAKQWAAENPERRAEHYRVKSRKRKYAIARDAFHAMVESQCGLCAVCATFPPRGLCVDHDHSTGKVRGLLCSQCNSMLGMAKDDVAILHAAIAYLELHAATGDIPSEDVSADVTGS